MGGGALFFRLMHEPERRPRHVVLSDLNYELMATYHAVQESVDTLIQGLGRLEREYLDAGSDQRRDFFYAVRDDFRELVAHKPEDRVSIATLFIFLNKTCFNGLYRVNRRGQFNVSHGRYPRPRVLDEEGLRAASAALAGVDLLSVDFEEASRRAGAGDFVYFDPPFHPLSDTSNFTAYTEGSFGRADQLRLRWWTDELSRRGAPVMLSNSDHPWIVGVYEGGGYLVEELKDARDYSLDNGRTVPVHANRVINSRGDRRTGTGELIITNYVPPSSSHCVARPLGRRSAG